MTHVEQTMSPSHPVGLERENKASGEYKRELSPSHAVGLEQDYWSIRELFYNKTSPSHTVGLERLGYESGQVAGARGVVTIPHNGLRMSGPC